MGVDLSFLPKSWTAEPLREAADFTRKPRGLILPTTVRFIPMDLLPTTGVYATRSEPRSLDELTSGTYVEDGDVMVAKITPCFENGKQGILAVGSPFAYATTEVIPLRGRPKKTDTVFLHFLLLHPGLRAKFASQMEGSTNRQRLPKEVVEKALVPVPPLDEQRQIAAVLSAVQRAVEWQERLVALTAELKKALTHKLFTEGTRGEALKQTEIGPVPESWKVEPLRVLFACEPSNGLYRPQSDYGRGVRILRIDDFSNDGDTVNTASNRVDVGEADCRRFGLTKGDIVLNRVNSLSHLGKTALIGDLDEPVLFESNMMRFRVDETRLRPAFAFRVLNSAVCKSQIIGMAKRAVAQSSVNQGDVGRLLIPLPPIVDTQDEILTILNAVDVKMAVHVRTRVSLNDIFRTLLHQLMTAQVRVRDLDLAALPDGFAGAPAGAPLH